MRICLCLSILMLIGCASNFSSTSSEWSTLKDTASIKCQTVPTISKIIGIEELHTIKGKTKNGFVMNVVERNGNSATYSSEIPKKTDVSDIQPEKISFGQDVIIAGGNQAKDMLLTLIVQKNDKGDTLEIRSNHDNVVRFNSPKLNTKIIDAKSTFTPKGFWLKFKEGDDETSVEDAPTKVLFVEIGKNAKLTPKYFNKMQYANKSELVDRPENNSAIMFWAHNKHDSSNKHHTFYVQELFQKGTASQSMKFNIPSETGLESWTATKIKNSYYIAYVDGDSLIGNASIKIAKLDLTAAGPVIRWIKTKPVANEHVSEPLWANYDNETSLLVPKWLDDEATIVIYQVNSNDVTDGQAHGIFPKGTRVMDTFKDPKTQKTHVLTRHKKGEMWEFRVCRL